VTGLLLKAFWPTQQYDNGLQNQLNCQLNSLIDSDYVAKQVYEGQLSQNMFQMKYWGFQYQNDQTSPEELINALDQAIAWSNVTFTYIQSISAPDRLSLMPSVVQVGQLHLTFLREQYLYRVFWQNQTADGLNKCLIGPNPPTDPYPSPTDCAVYFTNVYGVALQTAYDAYYEFLSETYPQWKSWRRAQMICQKVDGNKKAWAMGDVYSNTAAVGDVSAWYAYKNNEDFARDSICNATADLRMALIENYMIGLLDPAHYFHQYVPWMSQASSKKQPCLQQCFNSPSCNRRTADSDLPHCTSTVLATPPTSCNIKCQGCISNCTAYCTERGWSINADLCSQCYSGCEGSDSCSTDCTSCFTTCANENLNCNVNARFFPWSQEYNVSLFSGTLDNSNLNKDGVNPVLQAWDLNKSVQANYYSHDRKGLLERVRVWVRGEIGQTILGYQGYYNDKGSSFSGSYNKDLESDAFAYDIVANPRKLYGWFNNVTFTQQHDHNFDFKQCGNSCGTSQAPKFRGLNMDSPNFDTNAQLPSTMSETLNTPGILANFSSSPEYMIIQSVVGYYPYVNNEFDSSKRALSTIGWTFQHWIAATHRYAGINFPSIPASTYPSIAVGDLNTAMFPPQNTGKCSTIDVFPRSSGSDAAFATEDEDPSSFDFSQQSGEDVCGYEFGSECNPAASLPCCALPLSCLRHTSSGSCGSGNFTTERYLCVQLAEQLSTSPAGPLPYIPFPNGTFIQPAFFDVCEVPLEEGEPGFVQCRNVSSI
jgi:hypothetical protein